MTIAALPAVADRYLTIRFGHLQLGSAETAVLALAVATALLCGHRLWRIVRREGRRERLAALLGPRSAPADVEQRRTARWYRRLGALVAASPIIGISEQQRLLATLAAAGIRGHGNLASFVASKLCSGIALAASLWLALEWRQWFDGVMVLRLAVLLAALMLGWRIPDFVLACLAAKRRRRLEEGMPDALDLLVICAEAGLSFNQAVDEISRQLGPSNPDISEEFAATAAEMRVLPDAAQALENLGRRTGLDSFRSIIATLKQSMKFGTPLAESMRLLAAEMRAARQARMEQRTARLPVLLAVPIMMFILPSLLIVIGTPVAIRIVDVLSGVMLHLPHH